MAKQLVKKQTNYFSILISSMLKIKSTKVFSKNVYEIKTCYSWLECSGR